MTRHRGHKKSACYEDWALMRLSIPTGQGRVADASATWGIYLYGCISARSKALTERYCYDIAPPPGHNPTDSHTVGYRNATETMSG